MVFSYCAITSFRVGIQLVTDAGLLAVEPVLLGHRRHQITGGLVAGRLVPRLHGVQAGERPLDGADVGGLGRLLLCGDDRVGGDDRRVVVGGGVLQKRHPGLCGNEGVVWRDLVERALLRAIPHEEGFEEIIDQAAQRVWQRGQAADLPLELLAEHGFGHGTIPRASAVRN
jgi:hypothetical protein